MKRINYPAVIAVLTMTILTLTACGKSVFSLTENTGKLMTITAENADQDAFFMAGSLEVGDGEGIVIASDLTKGSVRVELMRASEDQSIDKLPETDGEPTITMNLRSTDGASGTVSAGGYLLKATCLEKATGPVRIEVTAAQIANPWREITEAEAKAFCPKTFCVPEGAQNVRWSVMDSAADPSGVPGALVQLSFDLNSNSFTAREQITGDEEVDQSGMYYEWTARLGGTLRNWNDIPCTCYRWIGEDGYADLCTWYEAEAGTSYSVSVTAGDLDGFDLQAIAEALAP